MFLDRDGVLIENREDYVRRWEEVELFPRAVEGCRLLSAAGYLLVVVSNQACVGRGILGLETVEALNARIMDALRAQGADILQAYLCPHHPDDQCECRKPRPGMVLRGAREHNIDLAASWMVGDNITDIGAAVAAGVKPVLVRTGRGAEQEPAVTAAYGKECQVFDDLLDAARHIAAVEPHGP